MNHCLLHEEFQDMVQGLAKSGDKIISQLSPEMAHLWHMATGVAGEAGELIDAVKKAAIYNKPVDIETSLKSLVIWSSTWREFVNQSLFQGMMCYEQICASLASAIPTSNTPINWHKTGWTKNETHCCI